MPIIGLGTTPEQHAAWLALSCPSGYSKMIDGIDVSITDVGIVTKENFCVDRLGNSMAQLKDPQIAALSAELSQHSNTGMIMFAAATASALLLPGWSKLIALPIGYLALGESVKGSGGW